MVLADSSIYWMRSTLTDFPSSCSSCSKEALYFPIWIVWSELPDAGGVAPRDEIDEAVADLFLVIRRENGYA